MAENLNQLQHVIFLGLADHWQDGIQPFPIGAVDLYQLSRHKLHIVYPGIIGSNHWVFLLSSEFLRKTDLTKWRIRVCDEADNELGTFRVHEEKRGVLSESPIADSKIPSTLIYKEEGMDFSLLHFSIDGTIHHPGTYRVQSILEEKVVEIGSVQFHYQKSPALTPDQIKAIESDPHSAKTVFMKFSCKHCPSSINVYTGLNRSMEIEKEGAIWQLNVADRFRCECGKTTFSLEYLRESMHGLLLKDFALEVSGLSYIRRYGHQQVIKVVGEFRRLLVSEKTEQPIQKFIEENPILLSRFSAKRLFIKPNIVGRFQADFVVLDSKNRLWFIELERPSLKLFKKDGHPTAALMHAYEQVNDWLQQYTKYQNAILEGLKLKTSDVVATGAAVIAGRNELIPIEVLQRFSLNPPYHNIEFLTLDDLCESLLIISRKLV
jgi:hypothetical protein